MYAGFSDTELARSNTAIKYRRGNSNFRVAGLAQIGGYDQGNGSSQMWQGQLGGDIHNLYGGTLSLDFVGSYAVDGALTSLFTTPIPKFYGTNDLKATLSNNVGFLALTKYLGAGASVRRLGNISARATRATTIPTGSRPSPAIMCRATLRQRGLPERLVASDAFNIQRVYNAGWTVNIRGQRPVRREWGLLFAWQNNSRPRHARARASTSHVPAAVERWTHSRSWPTTGR